MNSNTTPANKIWGGRFAAAADNLTRDFSASVSVDKQLYQHDIIASVAHARMLALAGIVDAAACDRIIDGLEKIRLEIEQGNFVWRQELEDVHMNIEARLIEIIGEDGKKLHTARSRNDQVVTDMRLYLRDEVDGIRESLAAAMLSLTELAEREADTIMPGMTHLQPAQAVSFGHHMLAWFEMLLRDDARLMDARKRINISPLGAAALAGTGFPVDRNYTAESLGFSAIAANSMDAVSDRDFCIEFVSACSILMMHLSRFSEELILWMNPEFGFIDLPDSCCTGSSIMPQKKNPDLPELVRGKSATVIGRLMSLLSLMKAQPLAYNRDNQEDKQIVFDTVAITKSSVAVYQLLFKEMKANRERMLAATERGFITATDLADYLVAKGMSFRDAHAVAGKAVALAITDKCRLQDLSMERLQRLSDIIENDVYSCLQLAESLAKRSHPGGSAPEQVRVAAVTARQRLNLQRRIG